MQEQTVPRSDPHYRVVLSLVGLPDPLIIPAPCSADDIADKIADCLLNLDPFRAVDVTVDLNAGQVVIVDDAGRRVVTTITGPGRHRPLPMRTKPTAPVENQGEPDDNSPISELIGAAVQLVAVWRTDHGIDPVATDMARGRAVIALANAVDRLHGEVVPVEYVYVREDPEEDGTPLPSGVDGYPVAGRAGQVARFAVGDRVHVRTWGNLVFRVTGTIRERDERDVWQDFVQVISVDGGISGRELPSELTRVEAAADAEVIR